MFLGLGIDRFILEINFNTSSIKVEKFQKLDFP